MCEYTSRSSHFPSPSSLAFSPCLSVPLHLDKFTWTSMPSFMDSFVSRFISTDHHRLFIFSTQFYLFYFIWRHGQIYKYKYVVYSIWPFRNQTNPMDCDEFSVSPGNENQTLKTVDNVPTPTTSTIIAWVCSVHVLDVDVELNSPFASRQPPNNSLFSTITMTATVFFSSIWHSCCHRGSTANIPIYHENTFCGSHFLHLWFFICDSTNVFPVQFRVLDRITMPKSASINNITLLFSDKRVE